jgi:hypothetical protein
MPKSVRQSSENPLQAIKDRAPAPTTSCGMVGRVVGVVRTASREAIPRPATHRKSRRRWSLPTGRRIRTRPKKPVANVSLHSGNRDERTRCHVASPVLSLPACISTPLSPPPAATRGRFPKTDPFRELRPRPGVIRGDHGIVGGQSPLGAVLLRRQLVTRAKIALQHLQLFSVLKADDVIGCDRTFDRYDRRARGFTRIVIRKTRQCAVHAFDERGQVAGRGRIATNIGANNH